LVGLHKFSELAQPNDPIPGVFVLQLNVGHLVEAKGSEHVDGSAGVSHVGLDDVGYLHIDPFQSTLDCPQVYLFALGVELIQVGHLLLELSSPFFSGLLYEFLKLPPLENGFPLGLNLDYFEKNRRRREKDLFLG